MTIGSKLLTVPVWQSEIARLARQSLQGGARSPLAISCPISTSCVRKQAELERQLALLRHVEAMRLYAAGHDGKLPADRDDIPVPLPLDPVTGKPFAYSLEGATAHIRGESAAGKATQRCERGRSLQRDDR